MQTLDFVPHALDCCENFVLYRRESFGLVGFSTRLVRPVGPGCTRHSSLWMGSRPFLAPFLLVQVQPDYRLIIRFPLRPNYLCTTNFG